MLPVVRALAKEGAIVSIDTRHVAVAKAAVRCGASIVNDVTGFTDQDGRVCRDEHLRRHRDACR